jgi:hypothetical protein
MNFVEGGKCSVIGQECLLGESGSSVSNYDRKCPLHGAFDVWITQQDELLISDIGSPSDEPKQNLALGINRTLAETIAYHRSAQTGTKVLTTQRKCLACGGTFWISEHENSRGLTKNGCSHLCPTCIGKDVGALLQEKLGSLGYWCG